MKTMLKDHLNWNELMVAPRYAGGHEDIMCVLFKDARVIASYIENDYQGTEAFVYELNGEFIMVTDYFGSCSGCDAWEDATDEDVKYLCTELANNAQRFDSLSELFDFLENKVSEHKSAYYAESTVAEPLLEELRKNIYIQREYNIKDLLDE